MNMMKINKTWPALVVIVALAGLVPFFTKDQYIIHVGVFLFLYITLASSLNIIVGFTASPILPTRPFSVLVFMQLPFQCLDFRRHFCLI